MRNEFDMLMPDSFTEMDEHELQLTGGDSSDMDSSFVSEEFLDYEMSGMPQEVHRPTFETPRFIVGGETVEPAVVQEPVAEQAVARGSNNGKIIVGIGIASVISAVIITAVRLSKE